MTLYAMPYKPSPPEKVSKILRSAARVESLFDDYRRGCDAHCGECDECMRAMKAVAWRLSAPDALVYEVWNDGEICGILFVTDIVAGTDAEAHFCFFDGKLLGRDRIIEQMIQKHAFGQLGLHRLTITIPEHAKALGRFINRKLGFELEGTKREAIKWRGEWEDVSVYGRLRA